MTAFFGKQSGIDAERAAELVRGEAHLCDVCEHDEWRAGRVPGAAHIPFGELAGRSGELPQGRRILRVENLNGGMRGRQQAGLPLKPPEGRVA